MSRECKGLDELGRCRLIVLMDIPLTSREYNWKCHKEKCIYYNQLTKKDWIRLDEEDWRRMRYKVTLIIETIIEGHDKADVIDRLYSMLSCDLLKISERNTKSITVEKEDEE